MLLRPLLLAVAVLTTGCLGPVEEIEAGAPPSPPAATPFDSGVGGGSGSACGPVPGNLDCWDLCRGDFTTPVCESGRWTCRPGRLCDGGVS